MAENFPLTQGALRLILRGGTIEDPIMQILGSKRIGSTTEKQRFRLLLSDGKNLVSFAMLTTHINDRIANGELVDNTIIKVKKYVTSVINTTGKGFKRVLVILEMEVLLPGEQTSKIGNPEPLPESDFEEVDASSSGILKDLNFSPMTSVSNSANINLNVCLRDQVTYPISSLSPYNNRWVIKARVCNKSTIRTWSNSRDKGQLFSMDLMDESGEIRCTIFRDLVDKFFDMIEVDKVYYITKCLVKIANRQFSNVNNDYEMIFTNETIVQECLDPDISIPQTKYDFISIDKIGHIESGTIVDVIGVCKFTSDLFVFNAKSTGKEMKKREVTLVDQSNNAVILTLWGADAEKFNGTLNPVISIKGAKITEYGGGKTLSIFPTSILKMNPDMPETNRLKVWFNNGGMQQNVTNISTRSATGNWQTQWISFKEIVNQGLGQSETCYFQAKVTILLFRSENCLYKACPVEECKRKVIDMENGLYRCEKCNCNYPRFLYRLLGSMNVGDWSGNQWISMFASETEKVLGMTSEEVGAIAETNPDALLSVGERANFKQFMFKCRAKMETYNDETRLKVVAIKVDNVNYKEYNAHLISRINQLLREH